MATIEISIEIPQKLQAQLLDLHAVMFTLTAALFIHGTSLDKGIKETILHLQNMNFTQL